jgi:hypothetical protein
MKRAVFLSVGLLACLAALSTASSQEAKRVRYTLLGDSYFLDQCLICARPDIILPLRGTFDLVLQQDTAPYTRYTIESIDFTAGPGSSLEKRISGNGNYVRFEEFAIVQDMTLATQIKDSVTNRPAFFTNNTRQVQEPFPLIQVDLTQTNGTLLQTFSMHLFAAPVREMWFATAKSFAATNQFGVTNMVNAGDLLSTGGRVVRSNNGVVGRLGVLPPVPNLGLDAVNVIQGGEILFSLPEDVFSETLGQIQHGDLLSDQGSIVKRNQDLLAAFHPASTADAGLDGVQLMSDGQYLFSIQSNVVVTSAWTLSRGDILSDRGAAFKTHGQLMANFQPAITNQDFGCKAFYVLPSGEIWFSVEEGFTDNKLGVIHSGDLLSSYGYRVFSNADLLAAFSPVDPSQDYGLEALFVVTDTQPLKLAPRILKKGWIGGLFHLEWDGGGAVFQVETAPSLNGNWTSSSDIIPDLSFDAPTNGAPTSFYRVRQW